MAHLGDLVRFVLSSPLPIYTGFFLLFLLFRRPLEQLLGKVDKKVFTTVLKVLVFLLLLGYAAIVFVYLFSNIYLDPVSASIVSVSAFFAHGHQLYHAVGAPAIYSLLYGPAAYVVNAFFMKLFGYNSFAAKFGSVASLGLTFVFLYFSLAPFLKKHLRVRGVLLFLGSLAAFLLVFWTYSFEVRPDVMSLMWVSLALFGVTRKNPVWAAVLTGIGLGMSFNLKVTGIFYFPPVLFLLYRERGVRAVFGSVVVGALAAVAPFALLRGSVNLPNYLAVLALAGKHGLDFASFQNNMLYVLFLVLPLLAFLLSQRIEGDRGKREGWYWKLLILSMVVVSVFASKAGSGQNHLLPFVPLLFYGYAMWYDPHGLDLSVTAREVRRLVLVPFVLTLLVFSFATLARVARLYMVYPRAAAADLSTIMAEYASSSVEMGYSGTPGNLNFTTNLPLVRPLLAFAGNNYILDYAALADLEESGQPLPPAVEERITDCTANEVWLFPRGTKPFENVLGYGRPLFDDAFRARFALYYSLHGSTAYYDVYACPVTEEE